MVGQRIMAKKHFQRFLPHPKTIRENKYLKIFGKTLHSPNLWLLNRYSVATAFSIGLFVAYIPLPGHMILAALLAILLRANLPVSMVLIWIVNPLTMIPIFGFGLTVGAKTLGVQLNNLHFHSLSFSMLNEIWQPLFVGCILCGTVLAILGNIFVRLFWRYSVVKSWQKRRARRLNTSLTPQIDSLN